MKLLAKINRYYLLSSLVVFLVGGLIFYGVTQAIIRNEVSKILNFELEKKIEEITHQVNLPEEVSEVEFLIEKVDSKLFTALPDDKHYQDTLLWDEGESAFIPYRQITHYRIIQGQPYRLTLRESLIEAKDLLFGVSVSLVALFGLMMLALWAVNYVQARQLWAGFYENIRHLRNYDVSTVTQVPPINSDIDEFQEMNSAIINMTNKIKDDYLHLKEFTENASHEMQTPLAIIRSNLDLLSQSELQTKQYALVSRISQATQRMSSTHRALLLLSKIENQQFKESTPINFPVLIKTRLEEISDVIAAKDLGMNLTTGSPPLIFNMNAQLADVLVDNLLSNAIKHNHRHGHVDIGFTSSILTMTNSGMPLRTDPEKLFQRFSKDNPAADSAGLGMAIMKVICDIYRIKITYQSQGKNHSITLLFPT